jgi:hypothetical protein
LITRRRESYADAQFNALAIWAPISRATAIRDFAGYVQSRPDVRFMRRPDIARWWLAHHGERDQVPGTTEGDDA